MDFLKDMSHAFTGPGRDDAISQVALLFALVAYVALVLDRRRDGSPTRDDGQIGLKVMLFTALAVAVLVAAGGAREVLAFVLGGFKGGWHRFRGPLAETLAGGGIAAAIYFVFLPRTNHAEKPQAERLAVGMVAVWLGGQAIAAATGFLEALFSGSPWAIISDQLAALGVAGGISVLMILRLGALSGWRSLPRAPQMPMAPPMGYPPQQPPMGGGSMPPLGGGYPPQQGGGWPPG